MRLRLFLSIILAISSLCVSARTHYNYVAIPMVGSNMPYTLTVDSIDFRSDLVRVYGHLLGTPNTSARIDGFFIKPDAKSVVPGTKIVEHEATDIDGFEFTHRFQWEDDGNLPIEIDFPPFAPVDTYYMRITYPNGWYGLTIKQTHYSKSKANKDSRKIR